MTYQTSYDATIAAGWLRSMMPRDAVFQAGLTAVAALADSATR